MEKAVAVYSELGSRSHDIPAEPGEVHGNQPVLLVKSLFVTEILNEMMKLMTAFCCDSEGYHGIWELPFPGTPHLTEHSRYGNLDYFIRTGVEGKKIYITYDTPILKFHLNPCVSLSNPTDAL